MRKNGKILALLLVALFALGGMAEAARLTVLHVNDTHGHAWPFDMYNNPGVGGFAPLATLIQEIRQEVEGQGGHVLLLHAGDFNTGVPESDQNDAMPDITVDPETYEVRADGDLLTCEPAAELPMAQRYFLF